MIFLVYLRWCFFSFLILVFYTESAKTQILFADEDHTTISSVLFIASYMNGGEFTFSAITASNRVIYIHATADGQDSRNIAYVGNKDMLSNSNLALDVLRSMHNWAYNKMDGQSIDDWIERIGSPPEIPEPTKQALLVWGFLEEVCVGIKIPEFHMWVNQDLVCQGKVQE